MKSDKYLFYRGLGASVLVISTLWLIKGSELLFGIDLTGLGIYPRTLSGATGILTSPWIHGDFNHLISNSFPLLFLGVAICFFYHHIVNKLVPILYLSTGSLVWIAGRESFHIGASGLIYAVIGFFLFSGIFRKEAQSSAISLVFLFLYGGVFQGIFPSAVKPAVSWESHLMGIIVGGVCAFYFRNDNISADSDERSPDEEGEDSTIFTDEADYNYIYKEE